MMGATPPVLLPSSWCPQAHYVQKNQMLEVKTDNETAG